MDIDFNKNPRQAEFIQEVLLASLGKSEFRYICYGGGIRGGKTFAMLGAFVILCKMFPGSKWVIYRQDFTSLQDTTIPSMEKILAGNELWTWHRDKSNYHVEYHNKSKIFFYGENIDRDPELNSMLGLECNGIGMEQSEELSQKLFEMSQSRIGSWYLDRMPKPLILLTLNPTQTWCKTLFYEPYRNSSLEHPYKFIQALPSDNPYVTDDQWSAWNRLDDRYKAQYIQGDWTDFDAKDNLWAFAFNRSKHIAPEDIKPDRNYPLYLSFDFNRNPICCSIIQFIQEQVRVVECVKLGNSNIYELCKYIQVNYPNYLYVVTGDATGRNSQALVKDNLNYYVVISRELRIIQTAIKVPSVNPSLEENKVLVNSWLQNGNTQISPNKGAHLIYDLSNVRVSADGGIEKRNRQDPTQQADALDTFRYYLNQFHRNFLLLPK